MTNKVVPRQILDGLNLDKIWNHRGRVREILFQKLKTSAYLPRLLRDWNSLSVQSGVYLAALLVHPHLNNQRRTLPHNCSVKDSEV